MSLNDPKIFVAMLTWAVYSFALFARRTLGWTGRRAAWLSALGFAFVMLNFLRDQLLRRRPATRSTRQCISSSSASVTGRRRSICGNGSISRAATSARAAELARGAAIRCARRWCSRPATAPKSTSRSDDPERAREERRRLPRATITTCRRRGVRAAPVRARRQRRGARICSASPPASIRSSSASRRSSAR